MRRALYFLTPLIFLSLFYFYPLLTLMWLSFALNLSAWTELIQSDYYLNILGFTFWQATLSTGLTVALALPGAYVFARYRFPAKTALQTLTTVPFVLPTIVVANAFMALVGPHGVINTLALELFGFTEPPLAWQRSLTLILIAHVFYNYTIVLRLVGGFWANLDPRLAEAAQLLGCTRWQAFRQITLPLLLPVILAASLLVFIFCFTSFGVMVILGGPRYATLEVEIYRQAVNLFNLPLAAWLSLIQIGLMVGLMQLYQRWQTRPLPLRSRAVTQRTPSTWLEWGLVWGNVMFILILLGCPLAALIMRSIMVNGEVSFLYYQTLFNPAQTSGWFVPPITAIQNSLFFATATMVVAIGLGLMVVLTLTTSPRHKWLETIVMLPLATSAVTLGFGYTIALGQPPLNQFNLRPSPLLIIIVHTLVALPFVVRTLLPVTRAIQPKLREAAALLGATPRQVWWQVDWPLMRRALIVAAILAFTVSMGEFGATVFIARPAMPTLPMAIFRLLGKPGPLNYGQALALSSLLMLICLLSFTLLERFRLGRRDEF